MPYFREALSIVFCVVLGTPLHAEQPAEELDGVAPVGRIPDVIFIPTPQDVVRRMLQLAEVTRRDVLYDLGCGDGRIVVTANSD